MPVEIIRYNSPLIVTLPYIGTNMPRTLVARLADEERLFSAPDRFLLQLVGDVTENVNLLHANFHRFLSDVESGPAEGSPQTQKGMIGAVPLLDRHGASIWAHPPSQKEATSWRAMYYAPYHAALSTQLARMRAMHGHAVLLNLCARHTFDAPERETSGQYIGFADGSGRTCGIDLSLRIINLLKSDMAFTAQLNRETVTGGTTRRHGRPNARLHAIDLEIDDRGYLTQSDQDVLYDADKARPLRALLNDIIRTLAQWTPT